MLKSISPPVMLAVAAAVLLNWTQMQSDGLWFYLNFVMVGACALGALALWKEAQPGRRMVSRLLAVLALVVVIMAAVVEPLLRPLSVILWEGVNFAVVIALSFSAGLLLQRS